MLRPDPVSFEEIQFHALAMVGGEQIIPAVSIVVPVMDGAAYIRQALDSIINQNFTDYEVIVVDDGSTDRTREIVEEYARRDPRFRLVVNERNLGVAEAMNVCLTHARGRYIARLDADDYMLPDRMAQQFEYLENHPEVGLLGTAAYHIDEASHFKQVKLQPEDDTAIRFQLLFYPPFYHPSCMYRAEVIRKHNLSYNKKMRATEDMDFWFRMAKHTRMKNLMRPLILYRKHTGSISYQLKEKQAQEKIRLVKAYILSELGMSRKDAPRIQETLTFLHHHKVPDGGLGSVFDTIDMMLAAFISKTGVDCSPYRLKALAGKWIAKSILNSDTGRLGKAGMLLRFGLRLDYSLPFALRATRLFLYSRFWALKKPKILQSD